MGACEPILYRKGRISCWVPKVDRVVNNCIPLPSRNALIGISTIESGIRNPTLFSGQLFEPKYHNMPKPKKKKQLSFRYVLEHYVRPSQDDKKCSTKHIQELERHLKSWEEFWKSPEGKEVLRGEKLNVKSCERNHLAVFRRHLLSDAESPLKNQTVNRYLRSINQIIKAAEDHGLIKHRAKLARLANDGLDPAEKIYLRDEQIDALMGAADKLTWPKFESSGLEASTWWMCALVLFRIYGFRPQELLAYNSTRKPVTWKNISFDEVSPNPSTHEINKYGWLFYTPPKTQRSKPTPLYLPLTRHARAALDLVLVSRVSDDAPVFRMPFSQQSYLSQWYTWLEIAGVKPKI